MGDIRKRGKEVVGACTSATADDRNKIPKIHEVEANQFSADRKFHPDKDPEKLKQLIANRAYAQKNRQKRAQYTAEFENQAISLESKVGFLRSQVEAYQNQKLSLQIDQQTMKIQIVHQEKERVIKEEEIEKNKAEVKKLTELLTMQLQALRQMISVQPTSTSNALPFTGLGQANSIQDLNGGGRSREIKNTEERVQQNLEFKVKRESGT